MPKVHLDILIRGTDASRGMMTGFRQGVRAAGRDTAELKGHLDKLDRSLGGLNRNLDRLGSRWQNLAAGGERIGRGMTIIGGAALAGMGMAVKAAGEFDQGMRNVNSIMKLSEDGFANLEKQIKGIASDPMVTDMPAELARGLFDLASSGLEGQVALDTLKIASQGASAGLSTTADAARVLSSVMNAYNTKTGPAAAEIMDVLFATVDRGVVTFSELASHFATVSTTAASAGVKLEDIAAGMMTMTKQGHDAAISATSLSRIITSFLNPSKEMAAAIKAAGYESGIQILHTKGLSGAVEFLTQATSGNVDQMVAMLGEIRSVRAAMALTGKGAQMYAADLDAARNASGAMREALAEQSKAAAFQWKVLRKELALMGIELGTALLPAAKELIIPLKDGAQWLGRMAKEHPGMVKLAAGLGLANLALGSLLMNSRNLLTTWQLLGTAGKRLAGLKIGAAAGAGAASAGGTAAAATGVAIGRSASTAMAVKAPSIGAKIASAIGSSGVWGAIAAALVAMIAAGMAKVRAAWDAADKSAEEAYGAHQKLATGGTFIPSKVPGAAGEREITISEHEARLAGWEQVEGGWRVPEGRMPDLVKLGMMSRQTKEGWRLTKGPRGIYKPFERYTDYDAAPGSDLEAKRRAAQIIAASSPLAGGGGTGVKPKAGPAGGGAGGASSAIPDEEKKQWDAYLRGLQQRVDWMEAADKSEKEVMSAQEELAQGYDRYADRLDQAGDNLAATDARIQAMRLRQVQKEIAASDKKLAEGVGTELGGPNETWEDRLRNLQQQIDWAEAATGDEKSWQVVAAKQQMIEGLRSYATALRQSGQIQRATDLEIRAMRIQAELRKQGVDTRPRETWQQIGFGRVRTFVSSEGRRRREVDTTPRPGTFEYDVARAHRIDVISPSRDAMVAAQTAGGGAGQTEVKQVNVYIGGEKIDERVRGEVLESLRGTARQ